MTMIFQASAAPAPATKLRYDTTRVVLSHRVKALIRGPAGVGLGWSSEYRMCGSAVGFKQRWRAAFKLRDAYPD